TRRDSAAVVLEIDGAGAAADGVRFYRAGDEIVLTTHVPPGFLALHSVGDAEQPMAGNGVSPEDADPA
ncbi:MAG: hypothetical protein M3313_09885, partial [Actinomycetota bacterium]|nr:hypothetical protein [Actinomycetota bacterium]